MSEMHHKNKGEENFPVGKLIKKNLRPLVQAYYRAARLADDLADAPHLSEAEKLNELAKIEDIFCGRNAAETYTEISALRDWFQQENLDASLFLDLLEAFRRDARNEQPQIWEQLLDYCRFSAAPVGRFMLAIHDENPSTYLPAATLCAVLQIVNHVQDLKTDAISLKRFYLPQEMMRHHDVANSDLYLPSATPGLQALTGEICDNLRGMLKDAAVLPQIVRDRRLRGEIAVILSLTNSMLKKIEQGDVISHRIKLSKFDWLKASGKGLVTALFGKTKTCRTTQ